MRAKWYLSLGVIAWAAMAFPSSAQQTRTISGTLRDSISSEPLIVGSARIRGTTVGTTIRSNGQFILPNVPAGQVTVQLRSLGYRTRDVVVGPTVSSINVALERDVLRIEQVVITGQATSIERRSARRA